MIYQDPRLQKGQEAEDAMNDWLGANNLSYLYVNQSPDTFAPLFKGYVKRPDFLVLLESVGLIAVDVKHYTSRGNTLTLKLEEEVRRVLAFERIFRIPVWYAYYFPNNGRTLWRWISALKAVEVGDRRMNTGTGEDFIVIDMRHFEEITSNADLGKLYTHRLPGFEKVVGE